ncbi:sterol 3beta-glucosyltransferase [Crossiella equi]|uniref:Sterol 3beta-glucosyltransferase n=1 Tax=Crossiella equi TaxID=130796 RepID=A0ABS5AAL7_9PSEU|nr:glycosyltransferase [Crossiella equi]MBP2473630.1 sterol 3beta-glucosyltransferase [Crossiella equi]
MNVLLLAYGSLGDIQPFVALGAALDRAGHKAVVAAPARFEAFVTGYGLPFAPLSNALVDLADTPELRASREGAAGRAGLAWVDALRSGQDAATSVLEDSWAAAAFGPDLVVHHPITAGHHIAEKLGVPSVLASPQPTYVPTDAFPCGLVTTPSWLPPAFNRFTYTLLGLSGRLLEAPTERWRSRVLGLPRRRNRHNPLLAPDGSHVTVLNAFSRHVFPPAPDWPESVHTTGYWFLPAGQDWTPPAGLAAFLAQGPPPVCVTFGSTVGEDPQRSARLVLEAVRLAGVRAVLVSGWGGLVADDLPPNTHLAQHVPFDWLLPQVAAVVHHGGGGTSAAAVAAGRPQVACPFGVDQPLWSATMHRLGVAPPPLPQRVLTAPALAEAIRVAATDPAMARRAARLAELVNAEDGPAEAVRVLERLLPHRA